MRRLFALALSILLALGLAPAANADLAGLTPCIDSTRFQQRAAAASTSQAKARFARYSEALCGDDGLPQDVYTHTAAGRKEKLAHSPTVSQSPVSRTVVSSK